jgi:ubiquinone biosynthesis protein UbiJ
MTASPAWLAAVEAMLNRNLDESAQAASIARHLEGRSLRVDVASLLSIRAAVHSGRLLLSNDGREQADAVISGSATSLLNLLTADVSHPMRGTAAEVRGDAEVANRFRDLFKLARPDIEGEVSRFIGEIPAHGLARLARSALDWGRRAAASGRANIAEYLQEESRDLVNKTELAEFLRGVDEAREAADRVEARLAQLERRLKAAS